LPELPEVETVARGLRAALPGRTILSVRLGKTDFIDDPAALEQQLPHSRFMEVRRYGKFLALRLEGPASQGNDGAAFDLFVHLGMTGQMVTAHADEPVAPHTHVHLALDDGRELRYVDIRRFGRMLLVPQAQLDSFVARLGLEPLEMAEKDFRARLAGRGAMIKALLLDQRVFRGMGNIYTDESLFRARIHPRRTAEKLVDAELRALFRAMRRVLVEAIRRRGTSISDYVDSEGQRGGFQHRLRAYGREGKPCLQCREKIRRVVVAGRSSYFCPRCQKPPRRKRAKGRAPTQRKRRRTAPSRVHPAA
jgi:formamidopyrimidine-DNA glycosylase